MLLRLLLCVVFCTLIHVQFKPCIVHMVGLYAIVVWCIENFESAIQIAIHSIRKFWKPREYDLKNRFGDWAVVTGATDGIGREYAKQLASERINIVLVSRSRSKLAKLAIEIESMYNVQTKWIQVDFDAGADIYEHIESELQDLQIGILVNCVGRMYDYPSELSKVSVKLLWSLLNLNIGAMVTMSRIVIDRMKQRKQGIIVNISSGSELQPMPYATVYAATKTFVRYFTLGLQHELKPHGVSVQLVTPYCIQTKMHTYPVKAVVGSIFFPSVDTYVKSLIFTLGKTKETTGYWAHSIMNGAMRLLPVYIRMLIMYRVVLKIRNVYLIESKSNQVQAKQNY